jgi:hypothetical protein
LSKPKPNLTRHLYEKGLQGTSPESAALSPPGKTSSSRRPKHAAAVNRLLSVPRQAVEHLLEIDFGAKNVVALLFPGRTYVRVCQPDPEISTEIFLELAEK